MIFFKTVSFGNDFIHIELKGHILEDEDQKCKFSQIICNRKTGPGSDGVVYYRLGKKDVDFRIFNQDGKEAELSGNGMGGLSSVLFYLNHFQGGISLKTRVGTRKIRLIKRKGKKFLLNIEIGKPDFMNTVFFPFLKKNKIRYEFHKLFFYPVSVGNPHVVVLLNNEFSLKKLLVWGETLCQASIFPQGTNVELVNKDDKKYRVFYYERGVGKTDSSATGSAAVFAVLRKMKEVQNRMCIENPYQEMKVSGISSIYIESQTEIVYKGIYNP